jgi:hypothetical protein
MHQALGTVSVSRVKNFPPYWSQKPLEYSAFPFALTELFFKQFFLPNIVTLFTVSIILFLACYSQLFPNILSMFIIHHPVSYSGSEVKYFCHLLSSRPLFFCFFVTAFCSV